jgi:gas vesicle protein
MRQVFNFMMGVFMGALVGATVALLLAPEAGESVRADLRVRGEALVADVRHAAESRRIELTNRLETLRESQSTGSTSY